MPNTLLYYAYYAVALLYLASGFLLLIKPSVIHHLIPSLFPLLAHFRRQRIANAINLIIVGVILVVVGNLIVENQFLGFFLAFIGSALEVYLSIAFYLKRREIWNAAIHFVIHACLVVFIGWIILSHYSSDLGNMRASVIESFRQIHN